MNITILKNTINFNLLTKVALAGICLTSIFNIQKANISQNNTYLSTEEYIKQEQATAVRLNLFKKLPSFGFNNLKANFSYLQFLQYFGDGEAREKIGYSLSTDYFEILVENDPKFVEAYFYMASASSIFAGNPEKSISLISQGLEQITPNLHPQAYYLWVYKAIDEVLFLGDTKSAKESYKMAAQWAEEINTPESNLSAANIRQTARFLADDPDSTISRIGAWTMVLSSTSEEKTQQKAIEQIEKLGGQIVISPEGALTVKVPG